MVKSDYFWTDVAQARERLQGSIVLYDNEPVYVAEIVEHSDTPKAVIIKCSDAAQGRERKVLNSPKFKKFRELPKIGFVNFVNTRISLGLLRRRVVSTRIHGLSESNMVLDSVIVNADKGIYFHKGGSFNSSVWGDPGFSNTHLGNFPALASIIKTLKEGTGCAYNNNYAVIRDHQGYRHLYRLDQRVGLFIDAETLLLTEKTRFLREELQADPTFTLNTIREF